MSTDVLGTTISTFGDIIVNAGGSAQVPNELGAIKLRVTVDNSAAGGTLVDLTDTVLGVQISYGMDVGVSTASIELSEEPVLTPNLANFAQVRVYAGYQYSGFADQVRWSGVFLRTDANLWPHTYTMVCRGNLYLAQMFRNNRGLSGETLIADPFTGDLVPALGLPQSFTNSILSGVPFGWPLVSLGYVDGTLYGGSTTAGVDSTDGNIVKAILDMVPGIGDNPEVYNSADIEGTIYMLVYSLQEAIWPLMRSAWDMIQLFDEAFLGFRTFESPTGPNGEFRIVRKQVTGYAELAFQYPYVLTEGVDIWEAHGSRSVERLINACYVEGMASNLEGALGGLIYTYHVESNPFQSSAQPVVEQFHSRFIETSDLINASAASPLAGLNADRVAEWRLKENNRQLVTLQFTTYLDWIFNAGGTIGVNMPHAAVSEPLWIQRVDIRITNQPALFQQTLTCLGGGLAGAMQTV